MTIELLGDATAGAGFSPCHRYRYRLWRRWGASEPVLWIMLNPSTADHERLEPAITRCLHLDFDAIFERYPGDDLGQVLEAT